MNNIDLFFLIFNLNGKFWFLDKLMIFGATSLIYLVFLLILVLALKGGIKEKKAVLLILIGLPVAILFVKIIHIFIHESRPFVVFNFLPLITEKMDASFPSRHTTIISTIAFSFTYYKSKWAIPMLFIMLWIGASRVFAGVHYPIDILGGFIAAAIALFIGLQIKKKLSQIYFSPEMGRLPAD